MKVFPIELNGMPTMENLNVLPLRVYNMFLDMDLMYCFMLWQNLAEIPNRNFSPVFFIPIKIIALWELLQCLVLHYIKGKEFKETKVSIFCRLLAVLSPGILIPGISAHSPVNYIHAV